MLKRVRSMWPINVISVMCVVMSLMGSAAIADVVVLKNGKRIEGTIHSEDDKEVVLLETTAGGVQMHFINPRDIQSITRGEAQPAQDKNKAASEQKTAGHVLCAKNAKASSKEMADAVIRAIQDSERKKDDRTIVVLDGLELDSSDASRVAEAVVVASAGPMRDRLIVLIRSANEGVAVMALAFPRIVVAPNVSFAGFSARALTPEDRMSLVRPLQSGDPNRLALANALCSGNPRGGIQTFSAFDLIDRKVADASASNHTEVLGALGIEESYSFRNRVVRPRSGTSLGSQSQALIPSRIKTFNEGLSRAKEGIEAFRKYNWSLWDDVKFYWKSRRGLHKPMPKDLEERSSDAQDDILTGLGKAMRAGEFLEKQARHINDPRLVNITSQLETIKELFNATKKKDEAVFRSKCESVRVLKPLS